MAKSTQKSEEYCIQNGLRTDASDDIQKTRVIESAFKHCGFANDINGKENHLVKVRKLLTYKVPEKGQPKMTLLTKEEIKQRNEQESAERKVRRKEKRDKEEKVTRHQ